MELALGVDRGRVCLAEGTARSRVLRWERVQQVGGMKEDGCGWVYWVRSPRVLQTHLGSHPRLQEGQSSARRQKPLLAKPKAVQVFAHKYLPQVAGLQG